jgi:hypothetical protein
VRLVVRALKLAKMAAVDEKMNFTPARAGVDSVRC